LFTIDSYIVAESLEQAYELNQNRRNVILGGNLWLKMSRKKIGKAIDLSALGLNNIEENNDSFKIGCMCTLRDLEKHEALNTYFDGVIKKSVNNIVGVQLRNGATIGGTIFSRFGFSDVLTALLCLDAYVELYKGGIISISDFVKMPLDNDILVNIIIKKDNRKVSYSSHRMSSSDLPVLTCAVSNINDEWNVVIGARPMKAKLNKFSAGSNPTDAEIKNIVDSINKSVELGTNLRGSKQYRQILAGVLVKRNIQELLSK